MAISAEACSEIIRVFDSQGWHRTATGVDRQSGQWLVERLESLGLAARPIPFPFSRIDPSGCSVAAGPSRVAAVLLPDSGLPPPGTVIRGVFGPGSIGLVRTESHGVATELAHIQRANCSAIVVAVDGQPGGATLLNAWNYDDPGGVPVVQVPADAWGELVAARAAGVPVEVHCGGIRTDTTASNVFATVPGRHREKAPIVLLTPRSGWWHCAGERGGGLAIWLEVARLAGDLALERDLILLATTGHELGFIGVKRYFDGDPGLAQRAAAWLHLGANIGAAGAHLVVRASDTGMLALAQQAPELQALSPSPRFELSDRPVGEAGEVFIRGGKFVSLVGSGFPLFHSTLDRWPDAIDANAIAIAGNGVLQILRALDRQA
ncbi:MAG: hypothetical protein C0506_10840 [Anaerolinea sp.]|nr:hypothetical protein [Anaerolinea sp.]